MFRNKKILALIPARGGSKTIKLKNLKKIKNKTLIWHTANFIKKTKIFDLSIVSSDNSKIIKEAKKNKLEVIYRPKNLSKDYISDIQVILHALREINASDRFDYIVYLQPTSPIRKVNHLISTLNQVITKKYDGAWSVSSIDKKLHPLKSLVISKSRLKLYNLKGKRIIARQQLNQTYIRNGVFYIFSVKKILKKKSIYLNKLYPSITDYKTSNIDMIEDLRFARKLINK